MRIWAALLATMLAGQAMAADAPAEIKVGTLYAGSGQMASASVPLHAALEMWAAGLNKDGGVFVKGFGKKIPVRLVSYDDQSSPQLAGSLTNQLITQDHVDILLADSTSVMTATAVPVAREHKQLLFDPTGSSPNFFSPDNPYIILTGLTVTNKYPRNLAEFAAEMPKLGVKTVGLLYVTADYTAIQAVALREAIGKIPGLKIVFDRGVPASTTDYAVMVNNAQAAGIDALLEWGYPANEIAFLRALQDNGIKFKLLYTNYGLTEQKLMQTNSVADQLPGSFALASAASFPHKPNYGMTLEQFRDAFEAWVKAHGPANTEFGFNALAGYQVGLVIERTLAEAASLDQLELRRAAFSLSGKLETLDGKFELAPDGSQIGLLNPLAQITDKLEGGEYTFNIVWPQDVATAKPIYPAPKTQ